MKVIAVSGSPRKNGNTNTVLAQPTSQTKAFIDRLFPFLNKANRIRKKGLMVVTQGAPDINIFKNNIESLTNSLGMLGIKMEDTIWAGNGNKKGAIAADESLMMSAKQAGAKLTV